MSNDRKVIVLGSGPAGYTAAIYAARAGLEPLVLAGALSAGGALMNTTDVENFPGFPEGILGPELMGKMSEQAEKFGAEIIYEDATSVDLTVDPKVVRTEDETYTATRVIIATGSEYRHLNVDGEERLSGHGVSYCATCDGFFFKDQEIAVVGGGDSAMEEATFLTKFASKVYVIHRRDELRASQVMADRAKANDKIEFVWNSVVDSINGDTSVESVTLRSTVDDSTTELPLSGVFVAIGHVPRTDLFADQLTLDENNYIVVDEPSTRTSLDNVYACGDVVDHTYRQAITAAGSGCRAALDVTKAFEADE